jgi:drug/metabolite transporter superfamily protein YnfA
VDNEAADYAAAARAEWNAEWRREHGGSYARWLWSRLRRTTPEALVGALVLILLVGLMLLYPLALIL